MHFDDRLATVLRQTATGGAIARIQYRQLIDLLRSDVGEADAKVIDSAYSRLDELSTMIPPAERAAILREPMTRLVNAELVGHLMHEEPEVASAAVTAADLIEQDWLTLIPGLPIRARGILRHRRDLSPRVNGLLERLGIGDRGLPPVAEAPAEDTRPTRPEFAVIEGGAASARSEPGAAGIGAIVRRIEAFRAARLTPSDDDHTSSFPLRRGDLRPSLLALDFTTDAEGRVDWADGSLASSLVGAALGGGGDADGTIRQAMRHRQPLRALKVTLAGASDIAGSWRLDALPRFTTPDGRFLGYNGRLRRVPAASDRDDAADTMRQILHELRTPATAIQIAAEIIQQQLYGATPHEYRALAAAIAGDTAQILAGFDELDRLVKLESGALKLASGECDLTPLIVETIERLRPWTERRGSAFTLPQFQPPMIVRLGGEEAARLIWRLLAGLAGTAGSGDTLMLSFEAGADHAALTIAMPATLAERLDEGQAAMPGADSARSLSAGMFGIGFTLRLARAEAAAAGGSLDRQGTCLRLALPRLTPATASHSQA